jgi:uncharacterized protein (DUF58 family)
MVYYIASLTLYDGFMVALMYGIKNLQQVDVRIFPQNGILFAGQPNHLTIEVYNHKRKTSFLGGSIRLMTQKTRETHRVPIIAPLSGANVTVPVTFARRGRNEVTLERFESTAPLHLTRYEIRVNRAQSLLVYPAIIPLQAHPMLGRQASSAQARQSRKSGDDEFHGLRHYQEGDSLQRIHWKSSAKYDKLLIQQHTMPAGSAGMRVALVNDDAVWTAADFETACSLLFSLLWEPSTRSHITGVYLNHRLYPIQSQQQLLELVGWLSTFDLGRVRVNPSFDDDTALILPHPSLHAALQHRQDILAAPAQ